MRAGSDPSREFPTPLPASGGCRQSLGVLSLYMYRPIIPVCTGEMPEALGAFHSGLKMLPIKMEAGVTSGQVLASSLAGWMLSNPQEGLGL